MFRAIETLQRSLREFIEQPDYPTLILGGTDAALMLPTRMLSSFDAQDDANYYLCFPQPCTEAGAYFAEMLATLEQQLEALNAELSAQKAEPVPPLPPVVHDTRQPLARRLETLVCHFGEHLPEPSLIVWGLLPSPLTDVAGYRALVEPLLATTAVQPWMERHRFVLRDAAPPVIGPELQRAKNDRVLVIDVALDNRQVLSGLVQAASDPSAPKDERVLALVQLGAVDQAFRRYPEAFEKYGVAFNYYAETGNKPMQAVCLTNAGHALAQAGQWERALTLYRQSLAISVEIQSLPTMQAGTYGAGSCCLELRRWAEAEGYLHYANELAGKLYDPYAKCEAMEKLGLARLAQGKVDACMDIWVKGKELAKQFGHDQGARSILDRMIALCRAARLDARADALERERQALGPSPFEVAPSSTPAGAAARVAR
ncbi:MAG TPA: tetratricopeptide repeat protein [Polyangiaceae bacterium]|nr:tetratricopeptide repeat protein [Polyangiaceae bacterium]